MIMHVCNLSGPYQLENTNGTSKNHYDTRFKQKLATGRCGENSKSRQRNIKITLSRHINSCDLADNTNVCMNVRLSAQYGFLKFRIKLVIYQTNTCINVGKIISFDIFGI